MMSEPTAIAEYLSALNQVLPGGPLARRRILVEVEDHLLEAARHERAAGLASEAAERRAIERFGTPGCIAEAFLEIERERRPQRGFALVWLSVSAASVGALLASLGTQPVQPAVVGSFAEPIPAPAVVLESAAPEPAAARPALAPTPRHARHNRKHYVANAPAAAAAAPQIELAQSSPQVVEPAQAPARAPLPGADVRVAQVPPPPKPAPSPAPAPPKPASASPARSLAAAPQPIGSYATLVGSYPPSARWLGAGGDVLLILHVDASGTVDSAQVTKRLGYGLDEMAQEMMRQLRFRPARDAVGRPAASYVNWCVHFNPPTPPSPRFFIPGYEIADKRLSRGI